MLHLPQCPPRENMNPHDESCPTHPPLTVEISHSQRNGPHKRWLGGGWNSSCNDTKEFWVSTKALSSELRWRPSYWQETEEGCWPIAITTRRKPSLRLAQRVGRPRPTQRVGGRWKQDRESSSSIIKERLIKQKKSPIWFWSTWPIRLVDLELDCQDIWPIYGHI